MGILISLSAFKKQMYNEYPEDETLREAKIKKYSALLRTKPQLYHFVPCDPDNKPLHPPYNYHTYKAHLTSENYSQAWLNKCKYYKSREDAVLFKDFKISFNHRNIITIHNITLDIVFHYRMKDQKFRTFKTFFQLRQYEISYYNHHLN